MGANCSFMQCVFTLLAFATSPLLPRNKPSRESIFCGKVDARWAERALIMLNFLLKTIQKRMCRIHVYGLRNGKQVRLRTASACCCSVCSPQPTARAAWKYREHLPLTACLQPVGDTWNNFCLVAFLHITAFCLRRMRLYLWRCGIFVCRFVPVRRAYPK